MMKRILACMMAAMLLLACAGCGEEKRLRRRSSPEPWTR